LSELPLRRVLWVMLAYAVGAAFLLPMLDWLQRVLALPPLFGTLARGGMLLGVPLAIFIAWRYPALGAGEYTLVDEGAARDDERRPS
jgi:hypothetical protein